MKKIWMIYGGYCDLPKRVHYDEVDAIVEAERLAQRHPGKDFFVLEAKRICRTVRVEWELLEG